MVTTDRAAASSPLSISSTLLMQLSRIKKKKIQNSRFGCFKLDVTAETSNNFSAGMVVHSHHLEIAWHLYVA